MPPTPPSEVDIDIPPSTTTTIIPPTKPHTHTIIFLHGREDYGSNLANSLFDSKSSSPTTSASGSLSLRELFPSVKWVFPTAPLRYCARRDEEFQKSSFASLLEGEEVISQWFDIWDLQNPGERKGLMREGLRESIRQIEGIVEEEAGIVGSSKVILGGISQGCAAGIYAVLVTGMRIGGFMGVSGWLPFLRDIQRMPAGCQGKIEGVSAHVQEFLGYHGYQPPKNGNTCYDKSPMFFSHSKDDETVPFAYGDALFRNVRSIMDNHDNIIFRQYKDGRHWIHPRHGVDDMFAFLHNIVGIPRNEMEAADERTEALEQARNVGYEERCKILAGAELRNIEREMEESMRIG
ncbi:hypothetical protein HYALB_00003840 [Hymenoscyphus albidus]|uniref:Phospholipase/carboxylesterase/thioesterase domain-containing protein n=1 Tax=Hymenoscyphus albidus TaxID=595503 RepID=A0A9N9QB88_9HELO|nr:hypothetical protein HYALB_00003840 [Hymenoscyphus albidus]